MGIKKRIKKYAKAIGDAPGGTGWDNEAEAVIKIADKEIRKAEKAHEETIATLADEIIDLMQERDSLFDANVRAADALRENAVEIARLREVGHTFIGEIAERDAMIARLQKDNETLMQYHENQRDTIQRYQQEIRTIEDLQAKNTALKEKNQRAGLLVRGLKHEIEDLTERVDNQRETIGRFQQHTGMACPSPQEHEYALRYLGTPLAPPHVAAWRFSSQHHAEMGRNHLTTPENWEIVRRVKDANDVWRLV